MGAVSVIEITTYKLTKEEAEKALLFDYNNPEQLDDNTVLIPSAWLEETYENDIRQSKMIEYLRELMLLKNMELVVVDNRIMEKKWNAYPGVKDDIYVVMGREI